VFKLKCVPSFKYTASEGLQVRRWIEINPGMSHNRVGADSKSKLRMLFISFSRKAFAYNNRLLLQNWGLKRNITEIVLAF
jgi:hypothetical protein